MKTLTDIRKTKFYKLNKANHRGAIYSFVRFNFQGLVNYVGCRIDTDTISLMVEPKGKGKYNLLGTKENSLKYFGCSLLTICKYLEQNTPYFINPYNRSK